MSAIPDRPDRPDRRDVVLRARRPGDLPALVHLLAEQQPASSYPIRWPLPFPTEQFLVRESERVAWVAEVDGAVVGHAAVGTPGDLTDTFAAATGTPRLGMLGVLFTGAAARGLGVGGLLHDTAVAWIREQGEVPVLDVVPLHDAAVELYRRRGWVEVGRHRFPWLAEHLPDVLLLALPPFPSPPAQPSRSSTSA